MLRLFSSQLCKCSHFVFSCVKNDSLTFLRVRNPSHHRQHVSVRLFHSGSPAWKDALPPTREKPEEIQAMELGEWKSVMRSQAVPEEQQQVSGDGEEKEEHDRSSFLTEVAREVASVFSAAGKQFPENITDEELQIFSQLPSKTSKKKFLKFLAKKNDMKEGDKRKREEKKAQREALLAQREQDGDTKSKNTFLLQFWSNSLDNLLAWRAAQAMLFGQPLVFDMSYESHMNRHEMRDAVRQLMDTEGLNRRATDPFHLYFCNLQPDGGYKNGLLQKYGAEAWDKLLITSTEQQHVDIFPHEQLVYLTADSPNVLYKFDHSKVYIIGSLVDRNVCKNLSLATAKRLKLATARLPLSEFLNWASGGKNLTLNQMFCIMLTIKDTGNWEEALKFVPSRKHTGFSSESRFTARDSMAGGSRDGDNTPSKTRLQTLFKNNMERKKNAGKSKMWFHKK